MGFVSYKTSLAIVALICGCSEKYETTKEAPEREKDLWLVKRIIHIVYLCPIDGMRDGRKRKAGHYAHIKCVLICQTI